MLVPLLVLGGGVAAVALVKPSASSMSSRASRPGAGNSGAYDRARAAATSITRRDGRGADPAATATAKAAALARRSATGVPRAPKAPGPVDRRGTAPRSATGAPPGPGEGYGTRDAIVAAACAASTQGYPLPPGVTPTDCAKLGAKVLKDVGAKAKEYAEDAYDYAAESDLNPANWDW